MASKRKEKKVVGSLGELLAQKFAEKAERDAKAELPVPPRESVPSVEPVRESVESVRESVSAELPVELDDEALFRQAVEGLAGSQVYDGKFGQVGDDWQPRSGVEVSVEEVRAVRDDQLFYRTIGELSRVFRGEKYYMPQAGQGEDVREAIRGRHERHVRQKGFVPSIDLHRLRLSNVLEELEPFLRECQRVGHRFVRVIHGKGLNSVEGPVLRPLVTQWVDGSSICVGFFEDVDSEGDFGAIVVELRRPNP